MESSAPEIVQPAPPSPRRLALLTSLTIVPAIGWLVAMASVDGLRDPLLLPIAAALAILMTHPLRMNDEDSYLLDSPLMTTMPLMLTTGTMSSCILLTTAVVSGMLWFRTRSWATTLGTTFSVAVPGALVVAATLLLLSWPLDGARAALGVLVAAAAIRVYSYIIFPTVTGLLGGGVTLRQHVRTMAGLEGIELLVLLPVSISVGLSTLVFRPAPLLCTSALLAIVAMSQRVRRVGQLEADLESAQEAAARDALTGLWNRRAFMQNAGSIIESAAASGRGAVVLMCDLDHFKQINDTYGHATGDETLARAANVIARHAEGCRGIAARLGGEEFALLVECDKLQSGLRIADQLRLEIAVALSDIGGTVSVGLAGRGLHADDALAPDRPEGVVEALLHVADIALYRAKRLGRNRVEFGAIELELEDADGTEQQRRAA